MQACSRYGKITKLDYLFHKTGPQKGKPRGYAFVEYDTNQVRPRPGPARPSALRGADDSNRA